MRAALFLVPGMLGVVSTVYPESPRSWLDIFRLGVRVRVRVRVRLRNLTPTLAPKPKYFKPRPGAFRIHYGDHSQHARHKKQCCSHIGFTSTVAGWARNHTPLY